MFEEKNSNLTPVDQLGEFKLIEHVTRDFAVQNPLVRKGIGDDAAVYSIGGDRVHVVSTDFLMEGVHFDLSYVPLQHLGYKSVVVNLSDIVAMNAKPFGVTVSIAMSNRFTVEAIDMLYAGIKKACDFYGVDLLGGDTSSCQAGLGISVTAIGEAAENEIVYRSGARQNDLVCLTGDVGSAYAGLQVLKREKAVFLNNPDVQPDLTGFDYVVGRQLKPEARLDMLEELRKVNVRPTSMIDISDGLASELLHLCRSSKLGATIYQDKIILDHETVKVADEFNLPALTMGLNGGEDYELLFTARLEDFEVLNTFRGIQIIGHMGAEGEGTWIQMADGSSAAVTAQGFNHFKPEA